MQVKSIEELFGTLQQSVVAEWRKHLKTNKYSEHMALDEYYKEMPELIDSLVEAYQGCKGKVEKYINILGDEDYDALSYLEALRDICKSGRQLLDEPELESALDNVLELIDSTMYKLRELKEQKYRMKSLVECLNESLIDEARIPEITKFTEKEPTGNDRDHFVRACFQDKWFDETTTPVFVDFKDIADTSKEGVWTAFFNLGKKLSSSTTQVEISAWNGDAWEQFANATRSSRDRMWHPDWISVKNHPFK